MVAGQITHGWRTEPRYRLRLAIILDFLMVAFMLFVFVGGQPFESRSEDVLAEKIASQGQGDLGRQIFYFAVFLLIALITYRANALKKLSFYPLTMNLMTAWCLVTVFWALDPEASIRRVVLSAIIVYTTFNLFICVGMQRSLQLLRYTLAFLICASLISSLVIPEAVHPATESDKALIGAWKGVFVHKNIAAAIAANAIIVFVFFFSRRKNLFDAIMILISLAFLLGTRGKSAPAMMVAAIGAGFFYRYSLGFVQRRTVYVTANAALFVLLAVFVLLFQSQIADVLSNPDSFTGRVAVWDLVLRYIGDNPLTGAGYGSFWQIGELSPVNRITSIPWLLHTQHSHNGYLEMLVTTGIPGFLFCLLAVVVAPFVQFMNLDGSNANTKGMLYAIWVFALLFNMMETQIFTRDKQIWLMLILALSCLRSLRYERKVA
jgi:exopolysaccharide production protein ExoQ